VSNAILLAPECSWPGATGQQLSSAIFAPDSSLARAVARRSDQSGKRPQQRVVCDPVPSRPGAYGPATRMEPPSVCQDIGTAPLSPLTAVEMRRRIGSDRRCLAITQLDDSELGSPVPRFATEVEKHVHRCQRCLAEVEALG